MIITFILPLIIPLVGKKLLNKNLKKASLKTRLFLFIFILLSFAFACETTDTLLAQEAKNHLGKKYKWGTMGKTFDCSGLTYYCFKEAYDIELGRSARDQGYDENYERIEDIDDLLPDDIVCFDTVKDKDKSDHVGIYLGNYEFIHASSGAGEVVISRLDEGYYNRVFSWGLRVTPQD